MKKKILGGIAALAIAAVVAFNVSLNTKKDNASLLALANVEALANSAEHNPTLPRDSTKVQKEGYHKATNTIACILPGNAC